AGEPLAALRARAEDYAPGDTDLGWTRLTGWRSLLAAAFDTVRARATEARVSAEPHNVSAVLLAGWFRDRLGVEPEVVDSRGPGITEVRIGFDDSTELAVTRGDGTNAVLHHTGAPDRDLSLPRRTIGEQLAEELRRLDPDQPYAAALGAATGLSGLNERSRVRVHEWRDPHPEPIGAS
ncbi:MAG TPA: glucose-6-phosphate dehydrogenase assembly protein OpcA, partial [Cryptosporangiaceae bacterium]|nr:glucose-6-phosphate dehydrogenase assembly protein OpcA [Cryptosporangiaceae bacterium]